MRKLIMIAALFLLPVPALAGDGWVDPGKGGGTGTGQPGGGKAGSSLVNPK